MCDYKIATRYTALNDYIPIAPTNDEARKHNENLPIKSALEQISICERDDFPCAVRTQYDDAMFALVQTRPVNEPQYFVAKLTVPGMGGVFNVVNLHLYHYAGIGQRSDSELQANNPVKYTDPDGRASEAAGYSGNYSGKEKSPIQKIGDGFVNLIKNIGRGISDGASWIMENKEAIGNIIAGGVLILAGETTKKGGWALGVALSPESGGASVLIILTAEEAGKVLEVSGGVLISNGANMLMANSNKNYREKTRGQIKTTVK